MALLALKEEDIERAWRTVFTGPDGKIVFADFMDHLGFFDEIVPSEAAIINLNTAVWMLKKMGVYKEKNKTSIINTFIDRIE